METCGEYRRAQGVSGLVPLCPASVTVDSMVRELVRVQGLRLADAEPGCCRVFQIRLRHIVWNRRRQSLAVVAQGTGPYPWPWQHKILLLRQYRQWASSC